MRIYIRTDKEIKRRQDYAANFKNKIFALLGDKCMRCGFNDKRALQIDHINGGGKKQIRSMTWVNYYKFVIKNPTLFQTLCANCNWIKRAENNETRLDKFYS